MKITRREAVAVSGLTLAGGALASGSAVAQMEHEGHGTSSRAPAKAERRDDARTMTSWNDIAKGTQHPARTIEPGDLPPHVTAGLALGPAPSLESPQTLAETERLLIMQTLERSGWNHSRTAESLGIGRTTLWRKLKEYGIDR